MADILILTASFGMGHKSVANALKEQIEAEYKHVKVSIGDILEIVNPKVKKISSKIYSELTESYPSIYNKLYDVKAKNKNNIIDNMLSSLYYKRFYEYIKIENPKVIISTFPLCSCIVAKVKEEYEDDVILITVITDVVDSWEWIYEGTNKYLVPTEEIKNRLIAKEVNEDIILVTGIPVKKEFLDKNINFSTDQKNTILIVLSGIDSVSKELLKKLDEYTEYKIKIIAGRNEKLYRKLSDMAYSNLEIYGFVNNLNEMMDEAVYIVTKPGGVTVFEAINKEVPLIVQNPVVCRKGTF
jgi:processive 1,2-diacylglycerol beta-glucosyltransferase